MQNLCWTSLEVVYIVSQRNITANSFGENITRLFCGCTRTQCLWNKLRLKLKDSVTLLPLTPQAAIFSFPLADCQSYLIQNHILLISKLCIYTSPEKINF